MEHFERQTIIGSESASGSSGKKERKQSWGQEVKRWADQGQVEENDGPHAEKGLLSWQHEG